MLIIRITTLDCQAEQIISAIVTQIVLWHISQNHFIPRLIDM